MADVYPPNHVVRVPALTQRLTMRGGQVVADGEPLPKKQPKRVGGNTAEKVEEAKPAKRKRD